MAFVRAKRDVYLGEHGWHAAESEFHYSGPKNDHLEVIEEPAYHGYSVDELRDEANRRGLSITEPNNEQHLRNLLVSDDASASTQQQEQPAGPLSGKALKASEKRFAAFMQETSGGFHASDEDWTTVGMDAEGFPVPKGSAQDVSAAANAPERKAGSRL